MGNLTGINVQDGYAEKIWWGAIIAIFTAPTVVGPIVGIAMIISGLRERAAKFESSKRD